MGQESVGGMFSIDIDSQMVIMMKCVRLGTVAIGITNVRGSPNYHHLLSQSS